LPSYDEEAAAAYARAEAGRWLLAKERAAKARAALPHLYQSGNWDDARKSWERDATFHSGSGSGVEAAWRAAIAPDTQLAKAHRALGGSQNGRGDKAGAVASYRRAIAADPKHQQAVAEHAHVNLGITLNELGDKAGAEAAWRAVIAIASGRPNPATRRPMAHYNLATLLKERGDKAGAEAAFRATIAIESQMFPEERTFVKRSHNNLAALLKERGDLAGAAAVYRTVTTSGRRWADTDAFCNLGNILSDLGDKAGAEAAYLSAAGRESLSPTPTGGGAYYKMDTDAGLGEGPGAESAHSPGRVALRHRAVRAQRQSCRRLPQAED
jgi:TolA-binding protein